MRPTLVTVFAHPDDETFSVGGSMAAAVDAGARVVTICATRGEVGEIADPALATAETLGEVREAELRAACAELGVHDVRFLGYRDSGMEGTRENADPRAFANAPDEEVIERIAGHFRELRPDVVVTFEPGGVYGHPDHKKISRCATAAFDRVGGARLFYSGPSRTWFASFLKDLKAAGLDGFPFEGAGSFGVADEDITTIVEVGGQLERKKRALAKHRTQINPWLASLQGEWLDRILARESFGLVRGARTPGSERDLLAGLPAGETRAG
ncbi:MAG TPA: PIG-L family deacetylase [Candidatus Limnocylindria bacterium]|nr:PIG-L family deacetylase [Candidatus Limnocylindria bacterium]